MAIPKPAKGGRSFDPGAFTPGSTNKPKLPGNSPSRKPSKPVLHIPRKGG